MFFGPIGKPRWPPCPLIVWDIFNFSTETAGRNSKKLKRKQDLNVLYQVCVFRADQNNKMAVLASDWLRLFQLILWNRWTEFNKTWLEARSQRPLPSLCFFSKWEKQNGCPDLSFAETFSTSLKPLNRIQRKLDRKLDLNVLYQVCVFRSNRQNKMATLASDWLRHFVLLLWNHWMEFNETWQEGRSQCTSSSLCFSGRWVNKKGCPGWYVKKVAHCTQVPNMWPFGPLVFSAPCTIMITRCLSSVRH